MLRLRLAKPTSLPHTCNRIALLLLLTVVCTNLYRRLVYDNADPYHCNKLLHQGQFLDSPDRNPERRPFQNWQVPGCLLHDYTTSDIADCNEDGQVLFVGDTTVRQVFWAVAKKLDSGWVDDRRQELDKHEDLHLEVGRARLSFMWDPWLNSTGFRGELKAYMDRNRPENSVQEKSLHPSDGKRRSVLLFIGGGLWHARHLGDEYLPAFNHVVDRVAAVMSTAHDRLTSPANIRAHGKDGVDDQIFFAPVPDPIIDRLSPSREIITQNKIWAMNDHLQLWSNRGLNVPWSYRDMTANWPEMVGGSGLHVTERIASQMANVVLNYRCNAKAVQNGGQPLGRTCCSAYREANWVQIIAIVVFVPLVAFSAFSRLFRGPDKKSTVVSLTDAISMLMLAAIYCFIADRTHVFDKIHKEFANIDFRVMLGVAILLCLLSIQSVPLPVTKSRKRSPEKATRSSSFLLREQSDEFKGWMQIYVLVYAYTGAFNTMDFFKVFRVFIALYLLLSGYGHAMYFLRTNDFSLYRVMGVVLRLNTLPVFLAFALDRPYSSYHFAPLVTFWFLIVFLTLRIGQHWNHRLELLAAKVAIAALFTTMLIHAQGVIDVLASLLNIVFQADIDVGELRFNLGIDNYVVFVGIMIAAIHVSVRSILRTPYRQLGIAGFVVKQYFVLHQLLLVAFAITAVPAFWLLMQQVRTKVDYVWWMPYIAWLPALSFVVLRNATHSLRERYCASFAWLGRISLELYLLSQHIWLAGDGQGVLRIGFRYGSGTLLGDKWRDLVVLSPIFVWLAWKVHGATKTVTAWLLFGQGAMRDSEQDGRPTNGDVMELPGWHRPEGNNTNDSESRRHTQQVERKKLFFRVGGVAVAIWLVNLTYP
ncbi:10 TM acyl transferase domain found in Cas1p-domain-containing protein [Boeremia exigua]|uniref:10 TM acyl transferase domain found in Cas1p-domain-containing protein n=1 Tax=Boeremia exigua TaxID=749465 RepID=UPI001E8E39B6|nr:10 TM acyl transferase domain found in Cas1p-domain-containing protein [Boeremia exigua]KAH6644638.1 10 TM acyl transferase domain found in Cas1p-domain-containing protein [Boeremia exigua]